MPDKRIRTVSDEGPRTITGRALTSREGHVAPEMERQACHQEASAEPTGDVTADSRETRAFRLCEICQDNCRAEPDHRAEDCVEPTRRGRSAAIPSWALTRPRSSADTTAEARSIVSARSHLRPKSPEKS